MTTAVDYLSSFQESFIISSPTPLFSYLCSQPLLPDFNFSQPVTFVGAPRQALTRHRSLLTMSTKKITANSLTSLWWGSKNGKHSLGYWHSTVPLLTPDDKNRDSRLQASAWKQSLIFSVMEAGQGHNVATSSIQSPCDYKWLGKARSFLKEKWFSSKAA